MLGLEGVVVAEGWGGAGEAEADAVAVNEAVEVDSFAAGVAGGAGAFVAGKFVGWEGDADPRGGEQVGVGEFAVGAHLLGVFVEFGVEGAGEGFGGLEGDDAKGLVVVAKGFVIIGAGEALVEIDEGGGHLAEVAELEGALADAAAGDDGDGVGGAAVDFDEGYEALAVGVEGFVAEIAGSGIGDAEAIEGEHRHADAEDLAGAKVAVGDFGFVEEGVEGHC